jgi:hypothetical protein
VEARLIEGDFNEDKSLFEVMRERFRLRQLEKNAESIRNHHPEFRRKKRAIEEEIAKVNDLIENSAKDEFFVTLIEVAQHFETLQHNINQFVREDEVVGYVVFRKPELPEVRAARLKRLQDIADAKNPRSFEESKDHELGDTDDDYDD